MITIMQREMVLTVEVVRGDQILSIFKSSFLIEMMRGVREREDLKKSSRVLAQITRRNGIAVNKDGKGCGCGRLRAG